MILLKFINFVIYSILIVIFLIYFNVAYLFQLYKNLLFCDIKNNTNYDYIIVGAGSAGSILAYRLSKAGAKTLLVEAGGDAVSFIDIPVITPLLLNTVFDWKYTTVPQEHGCKGLINNQSSWPAGKIIGGSSRLNNMVYITGHKNDYTSWFSDFKDPSIEAGGLLHIDNQNWQSALSDAILEGILEMSHPLKDINKDSTTGFMRAYLTTKNGERWSTDKLIYKNKNDKLNIVLHSLVYRILFKSTKATGVEFLRNKKLYRAFAKRGVIISAGAVGSPKILMLSGIGPKQHLEELNINVVADLPVGKNLMDHIITGLDLITLNNNVGLSIADVINPYSLIKYYLFGKGPWTSGGVDIVGTFYTKFQHNETSAPDLQIMTFPLGISQDNGVLLRKNLRISNEIFNNYFVPLTYKTTITIAPVLLHPKSIGEIRLKSSNPIDDPLIDPKYLSNEEDVLTLIDGIQFVKKLIKTNSMKKLGAKLYTKPFPGCEHFIFNTLEYWKCYVRHLTLTTYHPGGTCKMGDVVDSKFRVYNSKNLYVVDASVFPKLPSGNTHAPVVMLSEKAARLIIKDYINYMRLNYCYMIDIFLTDAKCY